MTATKQQPIAGYRISDPSDPTIKPWLSETPDDNGYTSEPLYAGAAPVAVARWGVAAWMTPEGDRVVTAETMDGARKDGGASLSSLRPYTVALVRAGEPAAAAPALEAPAAPVRQPLTGQEIINRFDFLEGVVNEHYYLKIVKVAEGIQADALAAAPKAPAAPVGDEREAFEAWIKRDGGDLSTFGSGQNRHYNNSAVNNAWTGWSSRAKLAAPAAPAVDASDTALLDAMERERIAVIPEFEGPWDAQIFGEDEATLACGSGVTPRKAIAEALASLEARKAHDAAQAAAKGGGIVSKTERLGHANALIEIISRHGRRFFRNRESGAIARLELDASGRLWWIDEYRGSRVYTGKVMGYPHRWRGFSHGGTLRSLVEALRGYVLRGELLHPEYIAPSRIDPTNGDIWGYGAEAAAAVRAEAHALPLFQRPTGHKEST
ncbi:hypothetical protein [Delftia lacustris]|uniref:hypothetical protein n=1 Tax=Delftia TaxID=80865 RepID=UPI002D76CD4F|nr:hypothetical protein [Delftia lacustris]